MYNETSMIRSLALHFNYREQKVCIPNIFLFDWEMDFCCITPAGVIIEVEVKISLADWQNDRRKAKWVSSNRAKIGRCYYAVPHYLVHKLPSWVPEEIGLISVGTDDNGDATKVREIVKEARLVSKYRASAKDIETLYRGAHFRYWDKKTGCV